MNIIDDIFSMMDYFENCEDDMSGSYHGELVDEYADGPFTVEVYADGYTMRFCDRD